MRYMKSQLKVAAGRSFRTLPPVEAYDWFRYVMQKLPLCQSDAEVEALMPFNIDRGLIARQAV